MSKWVYNGVEFRPGDRVKVVRFEADYASDGMGDGRQWENMWIDGMTDPDGGMDKAIGQEFEISSIDEGGVIFTDWADYEYEAERPYAIFSYPLSVLEKLH